MKITTKKRLVSAIESLPLVGDSIHVVRTFEVERYSENHSSQSELSRNPENYTENIDHVIALLTNLKRNNCTINAGRYRIVSEKDSADIEIRNPAQAIELFDQYRKIHESYMKAWLDLFKTQQGRSLGQLEFELGRTSHQKPTEKSFGYHCIRGNLFFDIPK